MPRVGYMLAPSLAHVLDLSSNSAVPGMSQVATTGIKLTPERNRIWYLDVAGTGRGDEDFAYMSGLPIHWRRRRKSRGEFLEPYMALATLGFSSKVHGIS